jgi:hypothetical protein
VIKGQEPADAERRVLEWIVGCLGVQPFSWAEGEKVKPFSMTGAQWKTGIVRLRQRGILRTYRKAWGEQLFAIEPATFAALHKELTPDLSHIPTYSQDEAVKDPGAISRFGLAFELLRFLRQAEEEPFLVKKDGTVHKRSIQKVMRGSLLNDEAFCSLEWSYAFRDSYPPSFVVLMDLALRLGFLTIQSERASIHRMRIEDWLKGKTLAALNAELYPLWLTLCLPKSISNQHIAWAIERLPRERWVKVDSIVGWAKECMKVEAHDSLQLADEAERVWLKPLNELGWIELGSVQGQRAFRRVVVHFEQDKKEFLTEGKMDTALFVQPDFDVLVPFFGSSELLWRIWSFTEMRQADSMCVFKLTRKSAATAFKQGMTASDMLSLLASHAKYGVPEAVANAVEEWGEHYGKLRIVQAAVLSCANSELADEIMQQERIRGHVIRRLGDCDFLVHPTGTAELIKAMEHAGYTPNIEPQEQYEQEPSDVEPPLHAEMSPAASSGLIYPSISAPLFTEVSDVPQVEDCFPNLSEVPSIWLKQVRVYHESTRKEIIKQAIDWQTQVRLRGKGTEMTIAPKHVLEGRQEWTVSGISEGREVMIGGDAWEEMQLILPGINANN